MQNLNQINDAFTSELRAIGYNDRVTLKKHGDRIQFVLGSPLSGWQMAEALYAAKRAAPAYFPTVGDQHILLVPLPPDEPEPARPREFGEIGRQANESARGAIVLLILLLVLLAGCGLLLVP